MVPEPPRWPSGVAQYGRLTTDPRVLPGVGRFLRRTSLDELPQLVNVIRGEMSLVGPRPLPAAVLACLPPAEVAIRASVPPGLTGLWQVSGRSDHDLAALVGIDCEYVRSWSLALDLRILVRTPLAVVTGRGAY